MSRIIDQIKYTIGESQSIVGFETSGGGSWEVWDRYLTVGGKRAYHIGNICGTCSFFFLRLEGAAGSVSPAEIRDRLNEGIGILDKRLLDDISAIMPKGDYIVTLFEIHPSLVDIGGPTDYFANEQVDMEILAGIARDDCPFNPEIRYYRSATVTFENRERLFEFIVPMQPQEELNDNVVNNYIQTIQNGVMPTALAISILDIKGQENWIPESEPYGLNHRCLAHYLLDGHHKVFAASKLGQPVSLLSFLAIEPSMALLEEIDSLMECLKSL